MFFKKRKKVKSINEYNQAIDDIIFVLRQRNSRVIDIEFTIYLMEALKR